MSSHEMTLLPLRIRVVTTKSDHQSWNYPNRISGLKINMINKVVAGDLTYVYLGLSLYYVFSLIDLYSNRVVGIQIGERMRSEDAKKALEGWVRLRGEKELINCIHHTDGGSQYFSVLYLEALSDVKVVSSVAGTCLENGHAEKWNGLFKYHFIPTVETQSLALLGPEIENICYFTTIRGSSEYLDGGQQ
ncbi:MAG: transposase family protein [Saprospiraceae bacterium]|nr:transposase family protein [Saprospiraceae bacterium]